MGIYCDSDDDDGAYKTGKEGRKEGAMIPAAGEKKVSILSSSRGYMQVVSVSGSDKVELCATLSVV